VKIALANCTITVTYPYITNAQVLGFFDKDGVDANVVTGQGSTQVLSLLQAGTVDVAICNPEPVIRLAGSGKANVRSVYKLFNGQYRLAVPPGSPIHSIADLKGKRLGMFNPQAGIDYLRARLLDVNMTPEDLTIVPIGFGGQSIQAIRNHQVDAVLFWDDAMQIFRNSGIELNELPRAPWEKNLPQYVVATTDKVIKEKPEALAAMLKAFAQGQESAAADPAGAVKAFFEKYPDQASSGGDSDKAFKDNLALIKNHNTLLGLGTSYTDADLASWEWGKQDARGWRVLQDNLFRTKEIPKKLDPSTYFTNQFIAEANDFDDDATVAAAKEHSNG
jgi:ABC-type nitrate/sulfonate/bicarbonate transport system substrate-binding protein